MLLPVPSVRFPIRFIPVRQGIGIILVPQFFIFLCSSFIITAQTLRKDGRTHSVRNDMVHIDQKEPAFLSILPQSGPKQGRFSQTEGPADLFHHFLKGISLQNRKGKGTSPRIRANIPSSSCTKAVRKIRSPAITLRNASSSFSGSTSPRIRKAPGI